MTSSNEWILRSTLSNSINSLDFHRIEWMNTPFDSAWRALSDIFWVGSDVTKLSAAKSVRTPMSRQMARATGHFEANLPANASSDWNEVKSKFIEQLKSYRIISFHANYLIFYARFWIYCDNTFLRRNRLVKLPFIDCIHSFSVFPNVYTCPRRWWMRLPWRQPQYTQKVVRLIQTDAHTKMTLFKHAAILLICINVWVWKFEFSADRETEGQFHSFLQIFCWFSEKRSLEEFLQISVVSVQL